MQQLELSALVPQETMTVSVKHPETGVEFSAIVRGPYSDAGLLASDALLATLRDRDELTPLESRKRAIAFVEAVLVGLPDVTVDGAPLEIRDAAHVRELCALLPYLPSRIVNAYMRALGFFAEPKTTSSPTSVTSETSPE